MKRFGKGGLLVAALLASAGEARSQTALETVWSDLKTAPGDLWYVWSAPARIRSDDAPALLVFTGTTLLVGANDAGIQQWLREHPGSVPLAVVEPFRQRNGVLSELGRNHKVLRGAAAGYVVGLVTGWDWLREASFGCAVGNTANALPRSVVYRVVARRRPSGETDPYQWGVPGGDWADHSFFGGHAANAFTCASFFAHRWDLGYAEPVVWVLASGVAFGRVADDAHWASDTLVGAGFGWVIGRMVAQRYRSREIEGGAGSGATTDAAVRQVRLEHLRVAPIATGRQTGLLFSAGIRF